ncbi:hypothetical protein [Brevibacillus sp. SAFN-007a]|uniref:hypothetical protein n=1 Tax=Brevibacillus sp. SAFN-007a TaxID=3436862 RepID=UPI003F7E5641
MAYLEESTFLAFLAFSIFFLVAYKLDQISFVAFVVSLIATALVHAAFYMLMLKYWPLF